MRILVLALSLATSMSAMADLSGRDIYNARCYVCHGYSGDARTLAASFLTPAPRNFQRTARVALPLARIISAVRDGVPGTAMPAFRSVLGSEEIAAVAAFVDGELLDRRAADARYHTAQNGWPDHTRYAAAFPFARGEIALDAEESGLTPSQRSGRRMFLEACITCHERARSGGAGPAWERVTPAGAPPFRR